jgi:diaminobutyrate-2-oxoglutarate transaminase
VPLEHTTTLPFLSPERVPDFQLLDMMLSDGGVDRPAAVILETVQGEGGVNVASHEWLLGVAERCRRHEIPLIVDDVQMGCGRTGPFFSFEVAGIEPDIVCLSKSISGYGLPLALTLIRPDLDIWEPGEHNGTFRGFNPALVTGAAALRAYWRDDELERSSIAKGVRIAGALAALAQSVPGVQIEHRGRGMVHGLAFERAELAGRVSAGAFDRGLLVERAGPRDEVVKLLPPLTVTDAELDQGLALLADAVEAAC